MAQSIRDCLARKTLPRLELSLLLSLVVGQSRAWLMAHDDQTLSELEETRFLALESRRLAGEPVAYLLGRREFMGHEFLVSPAVLIPRPETEVLVEAVLAGLSPLSSPDILDLGTGSGAIAVSLALARPKARVLAIDISDDALSVAQTNAITLGAKVRFLQGRWFAPLGVNDQFDIIVSNPPYVRPGDPHLHQGDLRFEPTVALTDGVDGLDAYRQIIGGAPRHLRPEGRIWLEHGYDQSAAVSALLAASGFFEIKTLKDLAGHPRVTTAFYNPSQ